MSEIYKKFRFTLRFILGNLHDFNPETDTVDFEALPFADKYMLYRLGRLLKEVESSYQNFQFFKTYQVRVQAVVIEFVCTFKLPKLISR